MKMSVSKVLFLVGMSLAVILGLLDGLKVYRASAMLATIIVMIHIGIGVAIGFMNIKTSERTLFLISTLCLGLVAVVVGWAGIISDWVTPVLLNFSYIMLSAGAVVGVKSSIDLAKN